MLLYESTREEAKEEEVKAASRQVEVLRKWPLSTGRGNGEGRKVPDGIRYHVLDVWVDELENVFQNENEEDDGEERRKERRKAVVGMITCLVEEVAGNALTKGVRSKSRDVLADGRLQEWR